MKALFIPVSVTSGFVAGFAAKKLFSEIWGAFDDQEPPSQEHRDVEWRRLIPALALQGIVFTVTRGVVDRGARLAFYNVTGKWPGEIEPDPE